MPHTAVHNFKILDLWQPGVRPSPASAVHSFETLEQSFIRHPRNYTTNAVCTLHYSRALSPCPVVSFGYSMAPLRN